MERIDYHGYLATIREKETGFGIH
jgi:hypothetical protein